VTLRERLRLLVPVVVVSVILDQVTKLWAQEYLVDAGRLPYLRDMVRIEYALNEGAFLGLGSTWSAATRFWVLTVATSLVLAVVTVSALRQKDSTRMHVVALALILGGGLGNLIDRALHDGVVVDFLNLGIGSLRTGIFNVADVALTVGVAMLFLRPQTARAGRE